MIFYYVLKSGRVVGTSQKFDWFVQPLVDCKLIDFVMIKDSVEMPITNYLIKEQLLVLSRELISDDDLLVHLKIKLLKKLSERLNRYRRSTSKTALHRQELVYQQKLDEAREYLDSDDRENISCRLAFLQDEAALTSKSLLVAATEIMSAHNRDLEVLRVSEKVRRSFTLKILSAAQEQVSAIEAELSSGSLFK